MTGEVRGVRGAMVNDPVPPGGLLAPEAFLQFTSPVKIEAWEEAALATPPGPRHERAFDRLVDEGIGEAGAWFASRPSGWPRRTRVCRPTNFNHL